MSKRPTPGTIPLLLWILAVVLVLLLQCFSSSGKYSRNSLCLFPLFDLGS